MKDILALVFNLFIFFNTFCQIHYFSDCFKGGIVGDGYCAWYTGGVSQVSLPIPSGSTIKKAFFFSNIYKWQGNNVLALDKTIEINGQPLVLSEQYSLGNVVYMSPNQSYISTMVVDITNFINSSTSIYSINPFVNISPVETPVYSDFYILVLYENNTFETSCIDVYINDKNTAPLLSYSSNITNAFDISENIGLAVHASSICTQQNDWYEVSINGTSIGQIGGQEDNTQVACAGVIGSFYYHEGELFGIGNDTSNLTMYGLDAIANIQPYVTNQNINVGFEYMSNTSPYSNLINQLFLTYTSPCSPFDVTVPNDTTICQGSALQLNASGGQQYEWTASTPSNMSTNPAPGLSCTNCPNPIFTADSSMFYTVRIWNNDSCSVVRPVKITVNKPPKIICYTSDAQCGVDNGNIIATNLPTNFAYWNIITPAGDTLTNSLNFIQTNLKEGTYKVFYVDSNGCKSMDTTYDINTYNNVIADFTIFPESGGTPLHTQITNTSQNASHYEWNILTSSTTLSAGSGNVPTTTIFDASGTYEIQLIAWDVDPLCADTISKTIFVYDSLMIEIPNVFTPNNDGINDLLTISVNLPVHCNFYIFNRWGNEIVVFDKTLTVGSNTIWDGNSNGAKASDGTYFYKAVFSSDNISTDLIKKQGFITLIR